MKKGSVSAISALVGAIFGAVAGTVVTLKASDNTVEKTKNLSDKHLALFMMMNQWVKVKQEGKNLSEYFEKQGYKWFYEISEEDVTEYCNNNDIEFTADGNVFIEPT